MRTHARRSLALFFIACIGVSVARPPVVHAQSVMILGSSLVRGIKPNLKKLLKDVGVAKPRIVAIGAPGWDLASHARSDRTARKLNAEKWDFVVMAGASEGLETQEAIDGAVSMHAKVIAAGAQPVFLLTWLPAYFPLSEYDKLLGTIDGTTGYLPLAFDLDTPLAPAGWAVRQVRMDNDPVGLWARSTHLSKLGRYLVAAVVFATITGESTVGKAAPKSFGNATPYLQSLADEIVFTDPEHWNIPTD